MEPEATANTPESTPDLATDKTYPAAILQWRPVEGTDTTVELQRAMAAGKPVSFGNIEKISKIKNLITEDVFTVCMCAAAMRSEPYLAYLRKVFTPTARRIHRGTKKIVFLVTKFPYVAAGNIEEIQTVQTNINGFWNKLVSETNNWEPEQTPPAFYADCVVIRPSGAEKAWSWFSLPETMSSEEHEVRMLISKIRARSTDPALACITANNLQQQYAMPLKLTAKDLQDANPDAYTECQDATALHAMHECIVKELAAAKGLDASTKLRDMLPDRSAILFLPLMYMPLPRCGVKLHAGIWASIADLTDSVFAHVYASADLRARVLILPSDLLDMPNIPVVGGLDLLSGRAYAYGQVAELLHTIEYPDATEPALDYGGGVTNKSGAQTFVRKAQRGQDCLLTYINQLVDKVAAQRRAWEVAHPLSSTRHMWRASGCMDDHTLPYNMQGYDRVVLTKDMRKDRYVSLAEMRAKFCAGLAVNNTVMLSMLKNVAGYAVSRSLVNPWTFVHFQEATNTAGGEGTRQLVSAFLRSDNNSLVLYCLEMCTKLVRVKDSVLFVGGTGPRISDVIRSSTCHASNGDSKESEIIVEHDTPKTKSDKTDAGVVIVHPYNVDAAGIQVSRLGTHKGLSVSASESDNESDVDAILMKQVFEPHGVWYKIGVPKGLDHSYPSFKSSMDAEHAGTVFEVLPVFTQADDPAMSTFFAGTRYLALSDRFGEIRDALGLAVSVCTNTPTTTDAWAVLSNHPLFMHSRLGYAYHIMEQIEGMKQEMSRLDSSLYNLDAQMVSTKRQGTQQPMTDEQYDALGDMPPVEALAYLDQLEESRNEADTTTPQVLSTLWMVYGRYDPLELKKEFPHQSLAPCPYTVKAVNLLKSKQARHWIHEVVNAQDSRVPPSKPLEHTTVPVIFRQGPKGLEFIGGFSELEKILK
jgi:hypothetical protein